MYIWSNNLPSLYPPYLSLAQKGISFWSAWVDPIPFHGLAEGHFDPRPHDRFLQARKDVSFWSVWPDPFSPTAEWEGHFDLRPGHPSSSGSKGRLISIRPITILSLSLSYHCKRTTCSRDLRIILFYFWIFHLISTCARNFFHVQFSALFESTVRNRISKWHVISKVNDHSILCKTSIIKCPLRMKWVKVPSKPARVSLD